MILRLLPLQLDPAINFIAIGHPLPLFYVAWLGSTID
jgi:hypothetical protein